MNKARSVEEYLSRQAPEARAALEQLRATIRAALPDATEGIAWGMCAFKLDGRTALCYAAFKAHYSLFPMSAEVISNHAEELGERAASKGTIRFAYGERLPVRLVRKIVKARVAEVEAKRKR
jgi:uncharacterized protein YdhG (YjbR/CyaY superfamily)